MFGDLRRVVGFLAAAGLATAASGVGGLQADPSSSRDHCAICGCLVRMVPLELGRTCGGRTEETAKEWHISREAQDEWALKGHQRVIAARARGFFDDLIVAVDAADHDTIPRNDTSMEKLSRLPPAFDRISGRGTLTAGNSSPLTDGAASVWVATKAGLSRLPDDTPFARLVDFEIASVDLRNEGLLMAPSYAIPRLFARHNLRYDDIDLWEIHEAFAAQVLANVAALKDKDW